MLIILATLMNGSRSTNWNEEVRNIDANFFTMAKQHCK